MRRAAAPTAFALAALAAAGCAQKPPAEPAPAAAAAFGPKLERNEEGFLVTADSEVAYARAFQNRVAICGSIGREAGFLTHLSAKGERPFRGQLKCK